MAKLRNKRKLAAVLRETPEGSRSSRVQNVLDPELTQDYISHRSPRRSRGEKPRNFLRNLAKQSHVSWVACRNLTSFFWTHKFGLVPWLFQEHPEKLTGKTGRLLGIAPQTIPTPKWGIFLITLANPIAQRQKTTLTWWQELQKNFVTTLTWWQQLKKRFPTAPLLLRQANKRRRAPQVNHNFAVRILLRHWGRPDFFGPPTISDELQFSQFQ